MDQNLMASIAIANKNNSWVNDSHVTHCYNQNCNIKFSLYYRRHHCRCCGNLFCINCCSKYIEIPKYIIDRPKPMDYRNLSYYIPVLRNNEERVCDACYCMIQEKNQIQDEINEIHTNPKSIDQISRLSDNKKEIRNHYYDYLRNTQYYLPNHKFTDTDKKILEINSNFFSGHSKYLVQYIKSIDWTIIKTDALIAKKTVQRIMNILLSDKILTCNQLFCTRTCQPQLSLDDCVNILYTCYNDLPDVIMNYIFKIIKSTPQQIIICHLSFFVSLIKKNSTNKLLQLLLFDVLSASQKLIYYTYWFLRNYRDSAIISELHNINSFIQLFDEKLVTKMQKEYMFYSGITNNPKKCRDYLKNCFEHNVPISLPYKPSYKLVGVDYDSITIFPSSTSPPIINFMIQKFNKCGEPITAPYPIRLLFKAESVMNDVTVLNLMTLCDVILKDVIDTKFRVVTYPVMPLTENSGMIEIVDQAKTIYEINKEKKTIIQHVLDTNQNDIVKDVLDRYLYSLVSYTLHSYFIGLGDRHFQNIMLANDGSIFHIDFGFILGREAYPFSASDIKLNSEMLDIIGGKRGEKYNKYLELCSYGVVILRKYYNIFFILLTQNIGFNESHVQNFIMSRFQPRQSDAFVIEELLNVIQQSNDAYSSYIKDFLHKHTQEKTVQNGLMNFLHNTFSFATNFSK